MHPGLGIAFIGVGAALSAVVGGWFRGRIPPYPAIGLVALAGVILGAGALLVQSEVSAGDWAIVVGAMAVLWPVHIRAALGPYRLKDRRLLAEDAPGA